MTQRDVQTPTNLSERLANNKKPLLYEWMEDNSTEILASISTVVALVRDWDDLWLAYTIASMELEVSTFSGRSNVMLLNEKYDKIGIPFDYASYHALTNSIDRIVQKMIPLWTEDNIPLNALSDKAQYLRDLLFLKAHYDKP